MAHTNGQAATWDVGENTVEITVKYGTTTKVYTVTVTKPDSSLSALTIGALVLTPAFDGAVTEYTVATSNATNTITATTTDENATLEILVGETPVESGSPATWAEGVNTVTITVTNGAAETVYTVTVTKS